MISLETGWKKGKLPEFSGIIDSGFSPILTHVLEDSFKILGILRTFRDFLLPVTKIRILFKLDFFKICQFFKFLADPQPFEMDGIIIDLCDIDLSPGIFKFPIKGLDLLIMRLFGELI